MVVQNRSGLLFFKHLKIIVVTVKAEGFGVRFGTELAQRIYNTSPLRVYVVTIL